MRNVEQFFAAMVLITARNSWRFMNEKVSEHKMLKICCETQFLKKSILRIFSNTCSISFLNSIQISNVLNCLTKRLLSIMTFAARN